MAKDKQPFEAARAVEQKMENARGAMDNYFRLLQNNYFSFLQNICGPI